MRKWGERRAVLVVGPLLALLAAATAAVPGAATDPAQIAPLAMQLTPAQFVDVTDTALPDEPKLTDLGLWSLWQDTDSDGFVDRRPSYAVAWGDMNGDGLVDLFLSHHVSDESGPPPSLLINQGDGTFAEERDLIEESPGAAIASGDRHGSVWTDIDNDGDQDLLMIVGLNNTLERSKNKLYINDDGMLVDVAPEAGITYAESRARDAVMFDLNNDGLLDVFHGALADGTKDPELPPTIFQQNADGTFSDVGAAVGFEYNEDYGIEHAAVADLNGDGSFELIQKQPIQVFETDNGQLVDITSSIFTAFSNENQRGLTDFAIADFNGDQIPDFFAPSGVSDNHQLILSSPTGWQDASAASGVRSASYRTTDGGGVAVGDFDNDMDLDIFVLDRTVTGTDYILENQGSGTFVPVAFPLTAMPADIARPDLRSVTTADFNNDGALDLLETTNQSDPTYRLLQNSGNGNNWLSVYLQGTASNRDGIGATVYATAGGVTQMLQQDGGIHHRSQDDKRLHFGLGSETVVDELRVVWPSGLETNLTDVDPNQVLTVIESDGVNEAPLAVDDQAATLVDVAVLVDVLDNDSEPDLDPFVIDSISDPANGTAVLDNGEILYTPDTGFSGVDSFTYVLSDGSPLTGTATVTIEVVEPGVRPDLGLLAIYTFGEGSGTTVTDVSNVSDRLDLTIGSPAGVTWADGTLTIDSATLIQSDAAATKLFDGITATDEVTIEAWIAPSNTTQTGPARIATMSANSSSRNITLGQVGDEYQVRLRTTTAGVNGVSPSVTTTGDRATTELSHVVYTRGADGAARIYVDGVLAGSETVDGDLSNWASTDRFGLGNEFDNTRPWLGTYDLVAIYNQALTPLDVQGLFAVGPDSGPPAHPKVAAQFDPNPMVVGETGTLTYSIENPNSIDLTDFFLVVDFPVEVDVTSLAEVDTACGDAIVDASLTTDEITLSNATLAADSTCTFTIGFTAQQANPGPFVQDAYQDPTPDTAGPDRVSSATPSLDLVIAEPASALSLLASPCPVYDSRTATLELAGTLDGGESRTLAITGNLPAEQGVGAGECVPTGATAVVFTVSAVDPVAGGNLRLAPSGVVPSGGVVNYTNNGLNNANTVTIPLSAEGEVDLSANGGAAGALLPSTDVRLVALGYYSVGGDLEYNPVTPCAVADSRSNQGGLDAFQGPFAGGVDYPDVDVVGTFPAGQGGGNTNCGVPADAAAVLVNVVAINPAGGSGYLSVGTGGTVPTEALTPFADIGMNNAATTIVAVDPTGSIALDITTTLGNPTTEVRVVVLGYYNDDGLALTTITPCAAWDSRPNQASGGDFIGERLGGSTTTYDVTGTFGPAQGGGNATCGVPDGAEAVLVNVVAINALRAGNLRISAAGTTATGGILNYNALSPAMNNANTVVVPLDALGQLDLFANGGPTGNGLASTHVRGVILGYYD